MTKHDLQKLIENLEDKNPEIRCKAILALSETENHQVAILISNIMRTDDSPIVRSCAANSLRLIWDIAPGERLVGALKDDDTKVRLFAAGTLSIFQSSNVVNILCDEVIGNNDPSLRAYAAKYLGFLSHVQDEKILERLVAALNDIDPRVQEEAIISLRGMHSNYSIKPLISLLKNSINPYIRVAVAEALGEIQNDEVVDALIIALDDKTDVVRREATRSLGQIGGKRAIIELMKLLNDSNVDVQWEAAHGLGEIGDAIAVKSLKRLLERDDLDTNVSVAVSKSIEKLLKN